MEWHSGMISLRSQCVYIHIYIYISYINRYKPYSYSYIRLYVSGPTILIQYDSASSVDFIVGGCPYQSSSASEIIICSEAGLVRFCPDICRSVLLKPPRSKMAIYGHNDSRVVSGFDTSRCISYPVNLREFVATLTSYFGPPPQYVYI